MSDLPGAIGRYQITGMLGRGAMGSIYRAHDPDIDRPVAIKLIHANLLDSDERADFIARFRREAQAAARCAHPNIVAIYDFALHDGNPFLAMEYVDGLTIAQAKPAGAPYNQADAVFIMLQVLAALSAAHAMGIVHRDIKPANIMLSGGTRVKVADFGIARMDTSSLTQNDAVIGTPSYMSPEQCRGETVDARSDIFSAGIVLFEMLSGQKPFAGRNAPEVFNRLLNEPSPDLRLLQPDLPHELCAVVARSLEKAASDRFATADQMEAELRRAAAVSFTQINDRTIVMPQRVASPDVPPTSQSGSALFDPALLDTLSRKMTEFLGPIGPYLVQSAARKSATVDALCAELAGALEAPAHRTLFAQEVRRQLTHSTGLNKPAGAAALTPAEMDRLQSSLAHHLGPVARVLIKRALASGVGGSALWDKMAEHIEDERARATFLRERSKSTFT